MGPPKSERPLGSVHFEDGTPDEIVEALVAEFGDACAGCHVDITIVSCPNHVNPTWHGATSHDDDCPELIKHEVRAAGMAGLN